MKLFLTIIVVVMLAGVFRAPAFLVCERPLEKADCVIAMLGGDFVERKREALSLIEEGVADTLLIPAWRKMIRYGGGNRKLTEKKTVAVAGRPQKSISLFGQRIDVYENTHLELLLAREMMVKLGLKSVVVVSSPYHMCRIQLIAGKVFAEGGYDIGLKSTSLKSYDSLTCMQSGRCRKHVAGEYLKIAWFLVYSWFV
jgi:hypothetical protein